MYAHNFLLYAVLVDDLIGKYVENRDLFRGCGASQRRASIVSESHNIRAI